MVIKFRALTSIKIKDICIEKNDVFEVNSNSNMEFFTLVLEATRLGYLTRLDKEEISTKEHNKYDFISKL